MKEGQNARVNPELTGLTEWIVGKIIRVRKNPF